MVELQAKNGAVAFDAIDRNFGGFDKA